MKLPEIIRVGCVLSNDCCLLGNEPSVPLIHHKVLKGCNIVDGLIFVILVIILLCDVM